MIHTAIETRRSIRAYRDAPVPRALVEEVLRAGLLAPSSKNRQPWQFVAVSGGAKREMLDAMRAGLERERSGQALLPGCRQLIGGAERTLAVMAQAPVTVLVVNPLGLELERPVTPEERIFEVCNAQSIGAAMENMSLAAVELGLGSLWICDIFFAHKELQAWLNTPGVLAAAMTLGYAGECPQPRPRKDLSQALEWRE